MNQTLIAINEEIHHYIEQLEAQHPLDYSKVTGLSIPYISGRLQQVKEKFLNGQGLTAEEEIFYFKHIKTRLLAFIQYYTQIQRIELNKPCLARRKVKKYYLSELFKIKRKLKKNKFFYNYFKGNSSHLDQQLFMRINQDIFLSVGSFVLDIDKSLDTPAVPLFARIEACEMLRDYLKKKIKQFDLSREKSSFQKGKSLRWTTSKVELTELIYALHTAGVFNNGRADIKEIAEYCQEVFDIHLGQYNRVFFDIRSRKINKTKFIDALKEALSKRMQDTENQLFY